MMRANAIDVAKAPRILTKRSIVRQKKFRVTTPVADNRSIEAEQFMCE